ncbi:hypothetical protein UNDKW_5828 [Undibacterium sp. KW1]|uniref:hypothetical protein n=1 Tax=Undibacterium sp. KW1 TaxID=2058624 RepID=UPI001331CB51|nr:hypothetical protein [Undibacterium sp. KW1]BBB64101.1 hypothetical protein UNDKW_5828 [Undibacterium sp. KW1]
MNKWTSLLAALAIGATATLSTFAHAGQLASISIINQSTGERLPIWRHQGNNYVAGKPGERYAVEITNKTGGRILSVLSVDGVNVLTGATASPQQSGYVLASRQPVEIKGWRKNMDEVAAFYFTQLPDSYAARTGRPDNVGVIGVALFREFREYREPVPVEPWYSRRAESAAPASVPPPAPTASALPPVEVTGNLAKSKSDMAEKSMDARIGTGHGERIDSSVRNTDFRRASQQPDEIISIQYDTYAHLVARGIIPRGRHQDANPFPGGFVPDPN